jgi:hypothetical protein
MGPTMSEGRTEPRVRLGPGVGPDRFWPLVALIAAVIATAGWTTVVVMSLNDGDRVAGAVSSVPPSDPASQEPIEDSPLPLSHEAPDLEALLPATFEGNEMMVESWTGETILTDDEWSQAFRTFLDAKKKTAADLLVAQASDSTGTLEMSVGAFSVTGLDGPEVLATVREAWKAQYPTLKSTEVKLGGKDVTRATFADAGVNSYWYVREGVVFDIETSDEELATAVLEVLP